VPYIYHFETAFLFLQPGAVRIRKEGECHCDCQACCEGKSTVTSAIVGQAMNDLGKLRRIALWFVLTISVPNFCACNTVAGLGKDMEKLGDKIEKKAEQKKRY
jgi:predicted small secreted protein